jgi:hypothetical protein
MRPIHTLQALLVLALGFFPALQPLCTEGITRREALGIAESYVEHHWHSSARNVLHRRDSRGVEVHTPDQDGGRGFPLENCWRIDSDNIGVAYKWGGLDTPESFDAGIRAGKAAGDVYTLKKRHLDGDGVSEAAVGIDCSGFICRCWKLKKRYSTYSLGQVCQKLPSPAALRPADIMNQSSGHVLLFVKFVDDEKKRAMFYESAPFSKTLASIRDVSELGRDGYIPMRYRHISE